MTTLETPMSATRVSRAPAWVAVGAWGFGLIGTAAGAAAIIGLQADTASRVLGALAVAQGLAALVWGTASLVTGRTPAPRGAVAGVLAGFVIVTALLTTDTGRASVLAIVAYIGLGVAVASGIARGMRHPARGSGVPGLLVAAVVVTLATVPALGVCQDAALLSDDGTVLQVPEHLGH